MAKKIILFVSPLRPGAAALDYRCPNHNTVSGAQTNEAPAKYLLTCYPGVSELLGIVTPEAQDTWNYLTAELISFCARRHLPPPVFVPISLQTEQDFTQEALPVILAHIAPGDELLLETTGGFRNAMMYLLLLSRILSYTGVPVAEAVYSNFQNREITSVSQLFSMFELAEGMQNLSAFGSVQALRAYYRNRPLEPDVEELLTAMERLSEAIILCRAGQIDACVNRLNAALARLDQDGSPDPLLEELLPVFRSKFGKDGRMTTPTLIRWCVENGMLQQALTVYTEQMPAYLMDPKQGGLICMDEPVVKPPDPPQQPYERKELAYFLRSFLHLPKQKSNTVTGRYGAFRQYIQTHGQEIKNAALLDCLPRDVPQELKPAIRRVVELVQAAEPCIRTNHWEGRWAPCFYSDALVERINRSKYKSPLKMVNDFQVFGPELIAELFGEPTDERPQEGGGSGNTYLEVIRNLERYLDDSGYTIACPLDRAKAVVADYVYIKFLRNMTNHANNESQDCQRETLDYLKGLGYTDIDNISAAELRQALLQALEHLEQAEAERTASSTVSYL